MCVYVRIHWQARAGRCIRTYAIIVTALASLLQTNRLSTTRVLTRGATAAHVLELQFSSSRLDSWQLGTGMMLENKTTTIELN